jgi:hypothetical protein
MIIKRHVFFVVKEKIKFFRQNPDGVKWPSPNRMFLKKLEENCDKALSMANRPYNRKKIDRNKLFGLHASESACSPRPIPENGGAIFPPVRQEFRMAKKKEGGAFEAPPSSKWKRYNDFLLILVEIL